MREATACRDRLEDRVACPLAQQRFRQAENLILHVVTALFLVQRCIVVYLDNVFAQSRCLKPGLQLRSKC